MHNGVVRTLIEVCHVPKLNENLVFVGDMDSKGFSCWLKVELCRSEGKGKYVVMQGTK